MTTIAWIHLSDWHQDDVDFNRTVVRDELLNDIRNRSAIDARLSNINFMIFSGDLAYHGISAEYKDAAKYLLDPVLNSCGLTSDSLFIVPGNHDINRNIVQKYLPPALQAPLTAEADVQEWLTKDVEREFVLRPFADYTAFVSSYTSSSSYSPLTYVKTVNVADTKIALIGLNSAWMSCRYKNAGGEVDDLKKLVIGEPQMRAALMQLNDHELKIVVIHHPLEWLADFDRQRISRAIMENAHFLLCGHEHQPSVQAVSSTHGDCVTIPAGASYERRNTANQLYANAYNYVLIDAAKNTCDIFMRRWDDVNSKWIEDSSSCKDGRFSLSTLPKGLNLALKFMRSPPRITKKPPALLPKPEVIDDTRVLHRGDIIDGLLDATFKLRVRDKDYNALIIEYIESQKLIPLEFFYSTDAGALAWLDLCSDQSYSVYGDSIELITKHKDAILEACGHDFIKSSPDFISLGPGNGRKDLCLLDSLLSHLPRNTEIFYYPIDISLMLLCSAAQTLISRSEFRQNLRIKAICSEFQDLKKLQPVFDFRKEPNLFVFLGNTLGNMPNEGEFLSTIRSTMNPEDKAIIEVRLKSGRPNTLDDPGGSSEKRHKFNFSPLEAVGVTYEREKLTFSSAHTLSNIQNTETLVGEYTDYTYLDKRSNSLRHVESTKLTYIHHYEQKAIKMALQELGFVINGEFSGERTILFVISKS